MKVLRKSFREFHYNRMAVVVLVALMECYTALMLEWYSVYVDCYSKEHNVTYAT